MAFDSRLLSGIQALVAAVEAGSFVRAATTLGITQSGVSRAIARLEHRVGVRLFDRTARAVALTDEGRSFYQKVKPLLAGVEDTATEAAGSAAVVRGRLRVNVDPFFARLVLAPRLGKFLTAYPELSVEIAGRDRLGDLVSDGFDAAVRFGEPEPSALVARRLLETRVLLGGCVAGHGVAPLLALGIEDLLSRGKIVELFPDWPGERFPLYVFHLSRHVPPAKVRAFLDFVVRSVR